MSLRVLIAHPDPKTAKTLENIFWEQGDEVWQAGDLHQVLGLAGRIRPTVLVLDLHWPDDDLQQVLEEFGQAYPRAKVLFTTAYPDPAREQQLSLKSGRAFLTAPYTRHDIRKAILDLTRSVTVPRPDLGAGGNLPRVRIPLRLKITIPYLILALFLALAAAFFVSRVIIESVESRFVSELVASGKQTGNWMVEEENRMLGTLRLVANTEGVAEAALAGNSEQLRSLTFNLIFNAREESVEILDARGEGLFSVRLNQPDQGGEYVFGQGGTVSRDWPFVQNVLERKADELGDKFAGLAAAPWGDYFYVAGPILDDEGQLAGVVLVGKSLAGMARQIREDTLAHVSLYDPAGSLLASTVSSGGVDLALSPDETGAVLRRQEGEILIREHDLAGVKYSELVSPWLARGDAGLGFLGTSLAQDFLFRTTAIAGVQLTVLVLAAFLLVLAVGVWVSNRITRPLMQVVNASRRVAAGELDVKINTRGDDEIAVLAYSFNAMVSGLREGSVYRDLLGRTVSPEIREQLRQSLATGELYLSGQERVATVLMSDIRGFTTLTESEEPATVMDWLNEYYGELVPIINENGGVVNNFGGDSLMAFFGILPRPLDAGESANRAALTALEMLEAIQRLNRRRNNRGHPSFVTGIVLNTGKVTAGSLGTADRLHYTVIGDTVNTTHRMQALTRRFGESCVVLSDQTYEALGVRQAEFEIERLGAHNLRGKSQRLEAYRLLASLNGRIPQVRREVPT